MRLIDADALNFEKLQDTNGKAIPANEYIAFLKGVIAAEELVRNSPTIDAEPVIHGHWIKERAISVFPICSNCNTVNACHSPYCGGCGAKMDEEAG